MGQSRGSRPISKKGKIKGVKERELKRRGVLWFIDDTFCEHVLMKQDPMDKTRQGMGRLPWRRCVDTPS